ncbi:NAD(P)/FAD-dependent oxidoreductase [Cupriavidus consociatus]|uniref:NAD(P)/FAD-dependent oxidoreductase n=1 Tax=Cupriavidus consociatus TaxID=2821357 RepID=UPI001FD75EA5|nr:MULTISPECIES: FAD/NAD(P)-binding oxidoreductase [unclassified Cupriavidus]MDK2661814.1 FAD/NAD(P)-binding oxidoreductase [Cupriavidus sp. LEh21]
MIPSPQNLSAQRSPDAGALASATVIEGSHTVVIVGGGAAGIGVAASLLAREPDLDIALIDAAQTHYYQPGFTMVGGGFFDAGATVRRMVDCLPPKVRWIEAEVSAFEPEQNQVVLSYGRRVRYERLIVCPGLTLNWEGIEGLAETLGRNGVTSNYRFDLAPYTWQLVNSLRGGQAFFTQPPMPIKCAGAAQKAMYLSCDAWRQKGTLSSTTVRFYNAGAVLFGVADYVPALMSYVEAYGIDLCFQHTLVGIDGPGRIARFNRVMPDGSVQIVEETFDMIHVVPPQVAPDFIKTSPLADHAGWIDVNPTTLRHTSFTNIWALGDATNTTNAKTMAAARKQAPIVAHNVLASLGRVTGQAKYDGYGSCPLTVERGKIVLAEFVYGGKIKPTFPDWIIDGTKPSRVAWMLKTNVLPPLYWQGMLKGREWLARPELAE